MGWFVKYFCLMLVVLISPSCQRIESELDDSKPVIYSTTNDFGKLEAIVRLGDNNKPNVYLKTSTSFQPNTFLLFRTRSQNAHIIGTRIENSTQLDNSVVESIYYFSDNGQGEFLDDDKSVQSTLHPDSAIPLAIGEKYTYFLMPYWTDGRLPPGYDKDWFLDHDNPNRDSFGTTSKGRYSFLFVLEVEIK